MGYNIDLVSVAAVADSCMQQVRKNETCSTFDMYFAGALNGGRGEIGLHFADDGGQEWPGWPPWIE